MLASRGGDRAGPGAYRAGLCRYRPLTTAGLEAVPRSKDRVSDGVDARGRAGDGRVPSRDSLRSPPDTSLEGGSWSAPVTRRSVLRAAIAFHAAGEGLRRLDALWLAFTVASLAMVDRRNCMIDFLSGRVYAFVVLPLV